MDDTNEICEAVVTGSPAGTSEDAPDPSPSPHGLPVFEAGQPLMLSARLTGAGGGIFVWRPEETGRHQLATDILPGMHKHPDWSPDGQHVVSIDEATERM